MQIRQLNKNYDFHWNCDHSFVNRNIRHHSIKSVNESYNPYLSLDVSRLINEATYKEIASLIDGNFLKQKVRADALNGITYGGFDNDILKMYINSAEFVTNGIRYINRIQFDQWDEVGQDATLSNPEKARLLLWAGNIRLSCSCPSFLYWGYNYLLTVLDAAIDPEERTPNIKNPKQRGIVCKHLNRVLRVLPFYSGNIANELRSQFG